MYNPTLNFRKHFFQRGNFFQTGTLFHKVNFFSRAARYSPAHESWELVSLDELSLPGILQLWNRRFLVSNPSQRYVIARRDSTVAICAGFPSLRGAIAPWQSVRVSRHCEQSEAILSAGKDCFTPSGFAMTNTTSPPEECKHHSSLRGTSKI